MKHIPLNKEQYSDSSKRSVGHEYLGAYYEDIHYKCLKCKEFAVFLAEDQKYFYEFKKRYMWASRKLCPECWAEYSKLRKELRSKESWYVENKEAVLKDIEFLQQWLILLTECMKFGEKGNSSRIRFLEKALQNF